MKLKHDLNILETPVFCNIDGPIDICDIYQNKHISITKEILLLNDFYWGYTANEEDAISSLSVSIEDNKGWVHDDGDYVIKITPPTNSDGCLILIDNLCDKYLTLVMDNMPTIIELENLLHFCNIELELKINKN